MGSDRDYRAMREELNSSKKRMKELERELAESKADADLYEIDEESGEMGGNVQQSCEKAASDIENAVNEGVEAGKALRRARRRNRIARLMLGFSNAGALATGALLLAFGLQQSGVNGGDDQIIQNPHNLLIVMGAFICFSALSGVMGALFARKMFGKAFLYIHSIIAIFVGCALMWGGIVSFAWPGHAQDNFNTFVSENPQIVESLNKSAETMHDVQAQMNNTMPADIPVGEDVAWTVERLEKEYANHTVAGGILCFLGAFFMMMELLITGTAIPEAPRLTLRRLLLTSSWVGLLSSLCLAVLSIVVGVKGGEEYGTWAAWLSAVFAFTVGIVSVLGIVGVRRRSILALILNLFLTSTVTIMLVMGAVLIFALPHQTRDFVHEHWSVLEEKLYRLDEEQTMQAVRENMDLIGIGSLIVASLLFLNVCACFGTIAEFAKERRRAKKQMVG